MPIAKRPFLPTPAPILETGHHDPEDEGLARGKTVPLHAACVALHVDSPFAAGAVVVSTLRK